MSNNSSGPIDGFALWLGKKLNGRKTWAGITFIVGGIATVIFTNDYAQEGANLIILGITTLILGVTHKFQKNEKR